MVQLIGDRTVERTVAAALAEAQGGTEAALMRMGFRIEDRERNADVQRLQAVADHVTVHGTGPDGAAVTYSGDGMLARCLQHETDHTFGTVFGDRLSTRWRKRLQKAHERLAAEYPDDWPVEPRR